MRNVAGWIRWWDGYRHEATVTHTLTVNCKHARILNNSLPKIDVSTGQDFAFTKVAHLVVFR